MVAPQFFAGHFFVRPLVWHHYIIQKKVLLYRCMQKKTPARWQELYCINSLAGLYYFLLFITSAIFLPISAGLCTT